MKLSNIMKHLNEIVDQKIQPDSVGDISLLEKVTLSLKFLSVTRNTLDENKMANKIQFWLPDLQKAPRTRNGRKFIRV